MTKTKRFRLYSKPLFFSAIFTTLMIERSNFNVKKKEGGNMITFMILVFLLAVLVVAAITFAGTFIVIFIDPIIFVLIITLIVKLVKWIKSKH